MKICFLGYGSSTHFVKWITCFKNMGHEVFVVSNDDVQIPDIKVYYIKNEYKKPFSQLYYLKFYNEFKKIIKEEKPDIIHALQLTIYVGFALLTKFKPFYLTLYGSDVLIVPDENLKYKLNANYCLKNVDLITCDAYHIVEPAVKLGAEKDKVKLVFFGVDIEKFKKKDKDPEILEKFDLGDSLTVISLRNLNPIYNIETLIKAIPIIIKEVPDIKFVIAGKGSEEEMLKDLASELGIIDYVRFIGWIPQAELPKYLNTSDIYVSTSLSDAGLASSTAEAMACELPVVITDFGDNGEWVKDGESGYLFPLRDYEKLADQIILLAKNPEIREQMGKAGREVISTKNNWVTEMGKMDSFYKKK